jgi:hypothetical protein
MPINMTMYLYKKNEDVNLKLFGEEKQHGQKNQE